MSIDGILFCLSQTNCTALDFYGNKKLIVKSIEKAVKKQCKYRVGPELEITGYSCEDHFLENDTIEHGYEVLKDIIDLSRNQNYNKMVIDVGLPIKHYNVLYNARVIVLNGDILFIRAKSSLAAGFGNYHENRYFTQWNQERPIEQWSFPQILQSAHQNSAPIGGSSSLLQFSDLSVAFEICEELWTAITSSDIIHKEYPNVIINSSASIYEVNKQKIRRKMIENTSMKNNCAYIYCNSFGLDGRMFFDGGSMIGFKGQIISQLPYLELSKPVNNLYYLLETFPISIAQNKSPLVNNQIIKIDYKMSENYELTPNLIPWDRYKDVFELINAPSLWIWDYFIKNRFQHFVLSLSGGADSSCVACIVYNLCSLLFLKIKAENKYFMKLTRKLLNLDDLIVINSPKDLSARLLTCIYSSTEYSSNDSYNNAQSLAAEIGCAFKNFDISSIVESNLDILKAINIEKPSFNGNNQKTHHSVVLQNLQARCRMVVTYLIGQMIGKSLILGTSNADEISVGFITKYDCSAADINPIGSLNKNHIFEILKHCVIIYNFGSLNSIINSKPKAELDPQNRPDEEIIGLKYEELEVLNELRKTKLCGPVSCMRALSKKWKNLMISETAWKVQRFFNFYFSMRHKTTILPFSFHMTTNDPENNRFDMRPVFYMNKFKWQNKKIKELCEKFNQ